eukprot:6490639-Amphidinium_carterae.4
MAYVDDFGIVDRADTCGNCFFAAERCLKTLGIRFSMKASTGKCKPFSETFGLLGVRIAFNSLTRGELHTCVSNTPQSPERVQELRGELEDVLGKKRLTAQTASRLRGRFGFFTTAFWNRAGILFMRALELKAAGNRADELSLDEEFAVGAALALLYGRPWYIDILRDAPPYRVSTLDSTVAFVEPGRCEGKRKVRIGGVLCESGGSKYKAHFALELDQETVNEWRSDAPIHVIAQAEAVAVLEAKVLWGPRMKNCRAIYAIDN